MKVYGKKIRQHDLAAAFDKLRMPPSEQGMTFRGVFVPLPLIFTDSDCENREKSCATTRQKRENNRKNEKFLPRTPLKLKSCNNGSLKHRDCVNESNENTRKTIASSSDAEVEAENDEHDQVFRLHDDKDLEIETSEMRNAKGKKDTKHPTKEEDKILGLPIESTPLLLSSTRGVRKPSSSGDNESSKISMKTVSLKNDKLRGEDRSILSPVDPNGVAMTSIASPIPSPLDCTYPSHPAAIDKLTEEYLKPLTDLVDVNSTVEVLSKWIKERAISSTFEKTAEGTFGSVYKLKSNDNSRDVGVLKLMPLNSRAVRGRKLNEDEFTSPGDAANEIELLARMTEIPGYVEFRSAWVLCGQLPAALAKTHKAYTKRVASSSRFRSYRRDQLWLLIEMTDAGEGLEESLTRITLEVGCTWEIFWKVALAVMRGEQDASFEHRDLHLGNICVKSLDTPDTPKRELEVTIIDFSLSRATLAEDRVLCKVIGEDYLSGEGQLQYQIYREMNELLLRRAREHDEAEDWHKYLPETNILWLWHLVSELLRHTNAPSVKDKTGSRIMDFLRGLETRMKPENIAEWGFDSAKGLVEAIVKEGSMNISDLIREDL
ncbi:hypothetical protein MMC12_000161 [Toensbergia leucococca]|nr:hypothetical protein [Toensbergia leucococca]